MDKKRRPPPPIKFKLLEEYVEWVDIVAWKCKMFQSISVGKAPTLSSFRYMGYGIMNSRVQTYAPVGYSARVDKGILSVESMSYTFTLEIPHGELDEVEVNCEI